MKNSEIVDVISVYKRIVESSRKGKGIRLSWEEACAVTCDGAVRQALDTAEDEERSND